MVTQRLSQWWFDLLDMFGTFNREVRNGTDKPGYRLRMDDALTSFDNWDWHEPWGDKRGITTYTPEQREVRNGAHPARLRLDFGIQGYQAGMLFSRDTFKYGCFEIRMKLPPFPVGAAFWMFSPSGVTYHEIDIAEFAPANGPGAIDFAYHTVDGTVWTSPFIIKVDCGERWDSRWHTYTLHWTRNCLTFLIDNALIYSSLWRAPQERMHLIAHMEVDAGRLPSQVPVYMDIDYIRAWEAAG